MSKFSNSYILFLCMYSYLWENYIKNLKNILFFELKISKILK